MRNNISFKTVTALVLAGILTVCPLAVAFSGTVRAAESPLSGFTEIDISTQAELIEFAENCHSESWSYE